MKMDIDKRQTFVKLANETIQNSFWNTKDKSLNYIHLSVFRYNKDLLFVR